MVKLMMDSMEEVLDGIAKALLGGSSGTAEVEEQERRNSSGEANRRNEPDPYDDDDDDYTTYAEPEQQTAIEDLCSPPALTAPAAQPLFAQGTVGSCAHTDHTADRTFHKADHRCDDRSRHR